jgi:hypothetical protein
LTIADSWTSRLVYTAFHLHARQQPCYVRTSSALLTSLTLRPLDLPLRQDTSDGRMPSWKRGEVGVDSRFSEQSIPGGLYVTIGTLGRLACRRWTVECANWWTRCRRLWPMRWSPAWHRQGRPILLVGRGSAGLTIPSSPCLHEAIVQAIDAITAGLRVLLRACRSTTLPFPSPDHARGRYDTTIVPCVAGSDVVAVSGPDGAGTGVPRVAGR